MRSMAVFLCMVLPWLNPFSFGPSPALVQGLVTLAALAFILLWAQRALRPELIASAWLTAASISAVIGLLQYFGVSAIFHPWVNTTELGEAFGNLRQRNQFATLTNIGLAALLWWPVREPAQAAGASAWHARDWRIAAVAAALLLALGNAASSSRTGLLQLLMLLAMAWAWHRPGTGTRSPDQWPLLLAAALAYLVAAFALPALAGLDVRGGGILARLHDGGSHCLSRWTLWSNVLHLIAQKPWLGWGWGELSYAHFMTLYPGERFCDILDNAHNLPLHLAVELGVPLSATVCGLAVWLVWRARPWHETDASRQLAWSVLALIMLHSMLEYPLWYGPFQLAFGLSLGLLWQAPARRSETSDRAVLAPFASPVWLTLVLLLAVAYAGWDYRRISQIYIDPALRAEAYREDTLEKIRDSRLFRNQVRFAELTTSTLTPENAGYLHDLALDLLHFSPEPRVVQILIESAALLGLDKERQFYLLRYRAAFPQSHALGL